MRIFGKPKGKDKFVHVEATEKLEKNGIPAEQAFIVDLKDNDWKVRESAAKALDQIGWKPNHGEIGVYYWIAKRNWKKCKEIGSPAVIPLIEQLKERANFANVGTEIRQVCYVLGEIGDNRAVEDLNEVLLKLENSSYAAAWALGEIRDKRALEPLCEAFSKAADNPYGRMHGCDICIEIINALEKFELFPPTEKRLVAGHIVEGLFHHPVLEHHSENFISKLGPDVIDPLISKIRRTKMTKDLSPKVIEIFENYGTGNESAQDLYVDLIMHLKGGPYGQGYTKERIIGLLGRQGTPTAIPILEKSLNDTDDKTQIAAKNAIELISSRYGLKHS